MNKRKANRISIAIAMVAAAFLTRNNIALAEQDVVTGSGYHRLINFYIDGNTRYVCKYKNELDEQSRLHDRIKESKQQGGLVFAQAASELGCFLLNEQRYDEAEPWCKQALEQRKTLLPENHVDVAASYHDLGALYELRKVGDPIEFYFNALKILTHFEPNAFCAYELQNVGELSYHVKADEVAEGYLLHSLRIRDKLAEENAKDTKELIQSITTCMEEEGKQKAAIPYIRREEEFAQIRKK